MLQPFLGDGSRAHHRCRQTCRRAATAARIANPVFMPISVVSMAGTKGIGNIAVILTALVFVADQQRNRRPRGFALVHAGQDLHRIGLLALRNVARGAGFAAIQFRLDVVRRQHHARWAAVDDAADGGPVGFAKCSYRKKRTKSITGHDVEFLSNRIPSILPAPRSSARL